MAVPHARVALQLIATLRQRNNDVWHKETPLHKEYSEALSPIMGVHHSQVENYLKNCAWAGVQFGIAKQTYGLAHLDYRVLGKELFNVQADIFVDKGHMPEAIDGQGPGAEMVLFISQLGVNLLKKEEIFDDAAEIQQYKSLFNSFMKKPYSPPGAIVGYKGTVFSFLQDPSRHIPMSSAAKSALGL